MLRYNNKDYIVCDNDVRPIAIELVKLYLVNENVIIFCKNDNGELIKGTISYSIFLAYYKKYKSRAEIYIIIMGHKYLVTNIIVADSDELPPLLVSYYHTIKNKICKTLIYGENYDNNKIIIMNDILKLIQLRGKIFILSYYEIVLIEDGNYSSQNISNVDIQLVLINDKYEIIYICKNKLYFCLSYCNFAKVDIVQKNIKNIVSILGKGTYILEKQGILYKLVYANGKLELEFITSSISGIAVFKDELIMFPYYGRSQLVTLDLHKQAIEKLNTAIEFRHAEANLEFEFIIMEDIALINHKSINFHKHFMGKCKFLLVYGHKFIVMFDNSAYYYFAGYYQNINFV